MTFLLLFFLKCFFYTNALKVLIAKMLYECNIYKGSRSILPCGYNYMCMMYFPFDELRKRESPIKRYT